ncbi:MAG: hypothetical protein ACC656_09340 [Candidatus Heimdallarchaeota archaeon]
MSDAKTTERTMRMFKKRIRNLNIYDEQERSQTRLLSFWDNQKKEKKKSEITSKILPKKLPSELNVPESVQKVNYKIKQIIEPKIESQQKIQIQTSENNVVHPQEDLNEIKDDISQIINQFEHPNNPIPADSIKFDYNPVEKELDLIIMEAIENPGLNNKDYSDIDPQLLNIVKKVFLNANFKVTDIDRNANKEDQIKDFSLDFNQGGKHNSEVFLKEGHTSDQSPRDNLAIEEEESFSSLAVTKEEIKSQIKNLMESINKTNNDKSSPVNSLQELEDQLKRNLIRKTKNGKQPHGDF